MQDRYVSVCRRGSERCNGSMGEDVRHAGDVLSWKSLFYPTQNLKGHTLECCLWIDLLCVEMNSWRTNDNCQLLSKLNMIYGKIFTKLGLFTLEKGGLEGWSWRSLSVWNVCHEQEMKVFSVLLRCKARCNVFNWKRRIHLRHHWNIYCLWIAKQRSSLPGSVVESLSAFKNTWDKQLAAVMG